ncbi:MAG: RraA family protein [Terriglobia bacterium]
MVQETKLLPEIDASDFCRRFSVIYTGAVSDVLDEMGYHDCVLPHAIHGLTMDTAVTGVAMTVEGQPTLSDDPEDIFIPMLRMLGDLAADDVIVSQPNDSVSAHLGELCCETGKYRGVRGAVIDGGVRDIDYILKLGFPVFCRYRTPADIVGRWKLTSYGRPVMIGKTRIERGDFIVGDKDGVLAIPRKIVREVLERAEEVVSTEDLVRKAILEGVHPVDAYRKYGRF